MSKPKDGLEELRSLKSKYRAVFGSPNGQAVLEDLEKAFYVHATTFRTGVRDEHLFAEGQRTVPLYIRGMMKDNLPVEEEEDNG